MLVDRNYVEKNKHLIFNFKKTAFISVRDLTEAEFINGEYDLISCEGLESIKIENFEQGKFKIFTNIIFEGGKYVVNRFENDGVYYEDSWIVYGTDILEDLGYKQVEGTEFYSKDILTKGFILEEHVLVYLPKIDNVLEGNVGDILSIYSFDLCDYGVINKKEFSKLYKQVD